MLNEFIKPILLAENTVIEHELFQTQIYISPSGTPSHKLSVCFFNLVNLLQLQISIQNLQTTQLALFIIHQIFEESVIGLLVVENC